MQRRWVLGALSVVMLSMGTAAGCSSESPSERVSSASEAVVAISTVIPGIATACASLKKDWGGPFGGACAPTDDTCAKLSQRDLHPAGCSPVTLFRVTDAGQPACYFLTDKDPWQPYNAELDGCIACGFIGGQVNPSNFPTIPANTTKAKTFPGFGFASEMCNLLAMNCKLGDKNKDGTYTVSGCDCPKGIKEKAQPFGEIHADFAFPGPPVSDPPPPADAGDPPPPADAGDPPPADAGDPPPADAGTADAAPDPGDAAPDPDDGGTCTGDGVCSVCPQVDSIPYQ